MKKLAGAAVGTLLIASMIAGSAGISGTVQAPMGSAQAKGALETNKTVPAATMPAAEPAETSPEDAEPAASEYAAYLFVHFVEEEKSADHEQIYFSVSTNGTEWTTLNNSKPVLKSNVGEKGVRDPHIIRTPDNKFRIIATDLSIFNRNGDWGKAQTGGSRNIIVWKSDTIDGWQGGGTAHAVGTEDSLDVWAPESIWDVDKEQYMVTWASIIGDRETDTCYDWHYRIYRSYTTDFETFSEPEVYMEREDNIIDTTFFYDEENHMYYRFTKDENDGKKWVFMEQGAHLDGEFEMVATYSLDGQHYSKTTGVEGPTVYKSNTEDKWFLLLDNWTYKPYETEDITKGVFTTAGEFTFNGPRFRHGSVIPITQAEYDELLKAYPNPTPDKTEGELIYELDFENENTTPKTGTFKVTENGTFTYEAGAKEGSKAAKFTNSAFMQIESGLFAGRENLTLSFVVNFTETGTSWVCFAAPNSNQMNDPPTYIGNFFKDGNVFASERFLNGRFDDSYDNTIGTGRWLYVTVVYYKQSTKVFLNGQLATGRPTTNSNASLLDILGETPSIFLGKATWGANGEFSHMLLDSFRVYDYAMPDEEVGELYQSDTASGL